MAEELGLPLAEEKMEGPATSLMFQGIHLNTVQQTSKLPESKLADLKMWIALLLQRKKVSLQELQEIMGHVNFACRVVAPGCAFLCQLCEAMKGLHHPLHRTRVTCGMRKDLHIWNQFLAEFNLIFLGGGEGKWGLRQIFRSNQMLQVY